MEINNIVEKINDLEVRILNLEDEISDLKRTLLAAMETLHRAFKMNCEGSLKLQATLLENREEIAEFAGTVVDEFL